MWFLAFFCCCWTGNVCSHLIFYFLLFFVFGCKEIRCMRGLTRGSIDRCVREIVTEFWISSAKVAQIEGKIDFAAVFGGWRAEFWTLGVSWGVRCQVCSLKWLPLVSFKAIDPQKYCKIAFRVILRKIVTEILGPSPKIARIDGKSILQRFLGLRIRPKVKNLSRRCGKISLRCRLLAFLSFPLPQSARIEQFYQKFA